MTTRNFAVTVVLLFLAGAAQAERIEPTDADPVHFKSHLTQADTIHFTESTIPPVALRFQNDEWPTPNDSVFEHSDGLGMGTFHRALPHPCPAAECDTGTVFHHGGFPGGFVPGDGIHGADNEHANVVPEPSTLVLICSGLLGLAGATRRKLLGRP